jgi:hypothetical protein
MKCLIFLLFSFKIARLDAVPAYPFPYHYEQPDGSKTPNIYLNGDERYSWLHDGDGFTVIQDEKGWYVYATRNKEGALISAGARVGKVDPQKLGLEPYLLEYNAFEDNKGSDNDEEEASRRGRRLEAMTKKEACPNPPCILKQLALLVRFADHVDRQVPPPEEIDIFFNHNGPTKSGTASTGSIADVYRANSFDNFVIDTHVTPWITISRTEKYASQGKNGFNFPETRACWAEALQKYAQQDLAEGGLSRFDEGTSLTKTY